MVGFFILIVSVAAGILLTHFMAKRGTGKLKRRLAGTGGGVLAFIVLALILNPAARDGAGTTVKSAKAPVASAPAASPQSPEDAIKALAPKEITKVEIDKLPTNSQVWVTLRQGDTWSNATSIRDFGMSAYDLLKKARPVLPADADVTFVLRVTTVDKYGNEGADNVLDLTVKGADLAKINFDSGNFDSMSLLNLATPHTRNGLGSQLVLAFCSDDSYSKSAQWFCRKAAVDAAS